MSETSLGVTRREALKRGVALGGAAVVWAAPTAQAFAMSTNVAEGASGGRGCTPGYWKNHQDAWDGKCLNSDDKLGAVFGFNGTECGDTLASFVDVELIDALHFRGGNGLIGKLEIFFRAAAAAKLNQCFVADYPWTGSDFDNLIYGAITSCDESRVVSAARQLDIANNLGCPFGNDLLPTGA
jgi:hypothetical protein